MLSKLAASSSTETSTQALRYVAVGALGFVLTLVVYTALLSAGVPYLAAAAIAFVCALVHNFLWNRRWTFGVHEHPVLPQALRYTALSFAFLAANIAVLHVFVTAGIPKVLAEVLAVLLIVPPNFFVQRRWGFTRGMTS